MSLCSRYGGSTSPMMNAANHGSRSASHISCESEAVRAGGGDCPHTARGAIGRRCGNRVLQRLRIACGHIEKPHAGIFNPTLAPWSCAERSPLDTTSSIVGSTSCGLLGVAGALLLGCESHASRKMPVRRKRQKPGKASGRVARASERGVGVARAMCARRSWVVSNRGRDANY